MHGWSIPAEGKGYEVGEKDVIETALSGVENGANRACLITLVNANSEQELAHINEHFDEASAQRRALVLETISAAA
jgi:nitrogen regulatory protein PII-like uncharacterized protein